MFQSKDSQVLQAQLKAQRLVIPFKIVGNASSTAVSHQPDEPSILFLKTEGKDDITAALEDGDVATYSVAADNSDGTFNVLVKLNEKVVKVCGYRCVRRSTVLAEADDVMIVALGNAQGAVQNDSENGTSIMLTIDGQLDLTTSATLDACLELDYVVQE